MSINNPLEELVDEAVPPSGTLNCKNLHELLHVIVVNLADSNNINMDYKCSAYAKVTQNNATEKQQDNVNQIKDQVKDLTTMSERQKKILSELEMKVKSLEEELNKVSKPGQPLPGRQPRSRSRSRSRSRTTINRSSSKSLEKSMNKISKPGQPRSGRQPRSRSRTPVKRSSSKSLEKSMNKVSKPGQSQFGRQPRSRSRTSASRTSLKKSHKTHSCMEPKRSTEWTTWNHPGKPGSSKQSKTSKMNVNPKQGDPKNANSIQIPELKKWIETKLRSLPVDDNLPERIDQLVKDKIHSTVVPDLKKMIDNMISQAQKDQKGTQGKSSLPLCLSCQNATGNKNQVSSQDCLCVIKRKLKNASKTSKTSKMNVRKR